MLQKGVNLTPKGELEKGVQRLYNMSMTSIKLSENGGKAPEAVPYMPAGLNEICCTVNGRAGKRTVMVDAAACERLEADLQEQIKAHQAGGRARPVILFDHKAGAAAAVPTGFEWDEKRGILLRVKWTQAGRAAVEGGNYAYISPAFKLAPQSESITGLQDGVEVGSLVNDPAFTRNECIAAAREVVEDVQVWAANPYGCNQYGHEWRAKHGEGFAEKKGVKDENAEVAERYNKVKPRAERVLKEYEEANSLWTGAELGSRARKVNRLRLIREIWGHMDSAKNRVKRMMDGKEGLSEKEETDLNEELDILEKEVKRAKKWANIINRQYEEEELKASFAELEKELDDEFVLAANPYGCNQYGEGWRAPHNGKQSTPGKAVKKEEEEGENEDIEKEADNYINITNDERWVKIHQWNSDVRKAKDEALDIRESSAFRKGEKEAVKKYEEAKNKANKKAKRRRDIIKRAAEKRGYTGNKLNGLLRHYPEVVIAANAELEEDLTPFCDVEKSAKTGDNIRAANNGSERTTEENSDMETVKKMLGLGADATPADVAAAIAALKKKSEAGQKRIEEVEAECNEHKKALQEHKEKAADGFIERLRKGGKVAHKDEETLKAAREMYMENPERTERIYAAMQPICPPEEGEGDKVQANRVPSGDASKMSVADFYAGMDF